MFLSQTPWACLPKSPHTGNVPIQAANGVIVAYVQQEQDAPLIACAPELLHAVQFALGAPNVPTDVQRVLLHALALSGDLHGGLECSLPYPPSVNRYYRAVGQRVLISREGREFRERVCSILADHQWPTLTGRLAVTINVFPPDNRRRDLDNAQKALLDALQHGGLYQDDSQIDDLRSIRRTSVPGGRVIVGIKELPRAN